MGRTGARGADLEMGQLRRNRRQNERGTGGWINETEPPLRQLESRDLTELMYVLGEDAEKVACTSGRVLQLSNLSICEQNL
jgi:hypothetical protein